MENRPQYVTIAEAAKLLDVTPTTLRNWDKAEKLVAHRDPINGYRLYSLEDISKLLQERGETYQTSSATFFQPPLFSLNGQPTIDVRKLRLLVRQMSQAFRDSMGGGLLERFEEISKLLYCKFYDERQVGVLPTYESRFRYSPDETYDVTYQRIKTLYEEAVNLLPEIFTNGQRHLSPDKKAIVRIVEILQDINLRNIPADVKGTVYETLIQNTFEKSDNQQFFTPRPIIEFIVEFVNPNVGQKLCDPACGSGGFLIEASKYIIKQSQNITTSIDFAHYLSNYIVGLEIDRRMAWVAQMNLIMHGGGQGNIHHLSDGGALAFSNRLDSLIPPNSFDIILTNPPFGSDFSDIYHLAKYQLGKDKSSRRRGILFIERCIGWLKPGGRLGIIVEDSILNGLSNKDVRRFVLERCLLEAVISLPDVAFMPYASVKTSIIFLRKRMAQEVQPPIFMAEVENVGRKPNGDPVYATRKDHRGNYLLLNDLPDVTQAWRLYQNGGEKVIKHLSPKIFVCPSEQLQDVKGDIRLDVQFYHPSRKIAENTLSQSVYPTPKLAELVVVRNTTAIPAKQDMDEIWRYIGLANIMAETGEYTVSQVIGSQLKSSVRLFRPNDILFSKLRPKLRKSVLIREEEEEGFTSSECLVFCTIENAMRDLSLQRIAWDRKYRKQWEVDSEYLAFILRSDIIFGQLVYQITGIGRPRVSKSTVLNLRIPLPPLSIQREIIAAYKMAWSHYLDCRQRSEAALREGEITLQDAYHHATKRLCPPSM